jgi:hypothetical protein
MFICSFLPIKLTRGDIRFLKHYLFSFHIAVSRLSDSIRSKVYGSFFGPQNPVSTQWAYDGECVLIDCADIS